MPMNVWALKYDQSKVTDDHKPTPEFLEAMKEMQNAIPPEKNYRFDQKWLTFAKRIFLGISLWFALLLLMWDVVIPYAAIKAIYWTKDDMAVCEGESCNESCRSVDNLEYDPDCLPGDRIYRDTPIWFNTNFRHEFGHLWTLLVTLHVAAAYFIFPSYLYQLFLTIPGRKCHKLCGSFVCFCGLILWTFGGIAAPILVGYRGLHPCAYVIEGYHNVNSWSSSMRSSFNVGLYLQFTFDGPLFSECLIIGISARLLIAVAFDPKYDYISQPTAILRTWYARIWQFISYSSLWLYTMRTCYAIGLVAVYFWTKEENTVLKSWKIQTANVDDEEEYCINGLSGDTVTDSDGNETFDGHSEYVTISTSMCIASGDSSDIHYFLPYNNEVDLVVWMISSIVEGVLIPLVNLPNLRAASCIRPLLRLRREIRTWTDKEAIKKEITRVMAWCKMLHGGNLTMAAWIVFWTFIGNALFSLGISGASVYLGGYFMFVFYWFCRCRCVAPCPEPYASCCGTTKMGCCHDFKWFGAVSCAEICACCIPPNAPMRIEYASSAGILANLEQTLDFQKSQASLGGVNMKELQIAVISEEGNNGNHLHPTRSPGFTTHVPTTQLERSDV